jgi:hypothetical protein
MHTEMPSDCRDLGRSSRDVPPTLVEVTFRPHSLHCCSFTAVIRDGYDGRGVSFGKLARLIKSIGYAGKINDFTIKPIEQHSFLLTGFSRHTSSQPSAVDTEALVSQESKPSSSDNDGGLSNIDPDLSSDNDGCSSEDEQGIRG